MPHGYKTSHPRPAALNNAHCKRCGRVTDRYGDAYCPACLVPLGKAVEHSQGLNAAMRQYESWQSGLTPLARSQEARNQALARSQRKDYLWMAVLFFVVLTMACCYLLRLLP